MRPVPRSATTLATLCTALALPALAVAQDTPHPPAATPAATVPAMTVKLPEGWQMHLDRANANTATTSFVTMGNGIHANTGPAAAIFWQPTTVASGAYAAQATFTQTRAPSHPEAYGLVLGGSKLTTDAPDYLYFVVRGDGKYMIRHRAGSELHTLADWTAHPAVKAADAAGKATNALRVRVAADSLRFDVNGTQVTALPRLPMMNTDGVVGLRINHQLDVHVGDFTVTPQK